MKFDWSIIGAVYPRKNRARLEAEKFNGTIAFAGRSEDYKYYNIDRVVIRALGIWEKITARSHTPKKKDYVVV